MREKIFIVCCGQAVAGYRQKIPVSVTMGGAFEYHGVDKRADLFASHCFLMNRRCGVTRVATLSTCGLIAAILFISGFSVPLAAQSGSIRLEGSVWDPSGNSLAGAILTAVEEETKLQSTAVSQDDGRYVFLALRPGTYTVTVKSKGLKDVIHRGMLLFQPGTISEDFSFEVSAIDKEVAIRDSAKIKDSERSGSFTRKEIEALPNLNRDPLSLVVYQPGIPVNPNDPGSSTVNGMRTAMNGIGADGTSVTDQVQPRLDSTLLALNPDYISEVQIVTAGGKAEFGRSGGAHLTAVSRPGTKSWFGEVYDYFRHQSFDANEFFNNSNGISKPDLMRNIFGGTISGPAFGKKTMLFANFEGNLTDQEVTRTRQVLTDEAKSGVFRWYTPGTTDINLYSIPANDPRKLGTDPEIASIIAQLPAPNNLSVGDGLNTAGYKFNNQADLNRQAVIVRVDHSLSATHQLFLRLNWARLHATDLSNNADASFPGQQSGTQEGRNWGIMFGSDLALGSRMFNQLRASYLRPETELERPARLTTPMYLANSWTNPLDPSFPRSYKSPAFEISDYLSHHAGAHSLKYGITFRRTVQSSVDHSGVYPNVTFGRSMGNAPPASIGPSGVAVISSSGRETFENLYNDLLGRMEGVSQTFNSNLTASLPAGTPKTRDFLFREFSGFIQDDWRLFEGFTLNLGVRYELSTVPSEKNDFQSALDQASQVGYSANISNFRVLQSNDWYSRNVSDFAPRAGFAWDIFGTGSTVLRGSYGIYYDRLIGALTNFIDQTSYGFSQSTAVYPNAAGGDLRLSDGVPLPAQPAGPVVQPPVTRSSSIAIFDPNLSTPRVQQWTLTLEKRLFGAILEASYVGTRGKRLFQNVNLNQTNTEGDFLQSFKELQAYRWYGTPVPATNTLVRMFGTPLAAMNALGSYVLDSGQVGMGADTIDLNHYDKYAGAGVSDFYLRNFPQFNIFTFGTNASKSWYDALQVGGRRNTKYSSLRVYYTWSKALDTISADGITFINPADNRNPQQDKAPSDYGRTHILNAAFSWAIPYGRNRSGDTDYAKVFDAIFGGWNLGLLYLREGGTHFSVNSGLENRFAGVKSFANFSGSSSVGNLYKANGIVYYFTPDEMKLFTYPVAGEVANSGRNWFEGPNYVNLDVVLQKRFMFRKGRNLQFRLEAFNVFNSARFSNPVSDLYDPNFGTVTSTQGNPRRMQASLRYAF
jgi:hypothetical protein